VPSVQSNGDPATGGAADPGADPTAGSAPSPSDEEVDHGDRGVEVEHHDPEEDD
jgi:hypothetical protein